MCDDPKSSYLIIRRDLNSCCQHSHNESSESMPTVHFPRWKDQMAKSLTLLSSSYLSAKELLLLLIPCLRLFLLLFLLLFFLHLLLLLLLRLLFLPLPSNSCSFSLSIFISLYLSPSPSSSPSPFPSFSPPL